MTNDFEISKSSKVGLSSKESYIVTRHNISYLRILGADPQWVLMTATADEDHGRVRVCTEQLRLAGAALRLGAALETSPSVEKDWAEREYVKICSIYQTPDQSDQDLTNELNVVLRRFFEFYDSWPNLSSRTCDEMMDLYDALATDDIGTDVYLSDGIWLSNNGTLSDRGR
ncbi:hypothetical protein O1Y80_000784 [Yersinia enterocolitica]|nr:hypothetical protein [Yersinia enterocolitica]EKN3831195.1 hypothetical protein [Yersinia enterocolitica]